MVAVQVQVPQEKVKQSSQRGKVHRVGQAREQADRQGDTCLAVRRAELCSGCCPGVRQGPPAAGGWCELTLAADQSGWEGRETCGQTTHPAHSADW